MHRTEPVPPHHPPLPFPDAHPTLRLISSPPRTLQPGTELSLGGDPRVGSRGAPRLRQRPRQRLCPLPGGRAAPGREPGGSLGGALRLTRLGPRRGRGVAAFVPADLLPLRQKLRVRANSRDVQTWGRRGVAMGLRPLPFLASYTKGRRGNAQSLPVEGGARPRRRLGLGSHPGSRRQQPRKEVGARKGDGGERRR